MGNTNVTPKKNSSTKKTSTSMGRTYTSKSRAQSDMPPKIDDNAKVPQKYAFQHILRHVGSCVNTKYVVQCYGYAPMDGTFESPERISKHFITHYWCWKRMKGTWKIHHERVQAQGKKNNWKPQMCHSEKILRGKRWRCKLNGTDCTLCNATCSQIETRGHDDTRLAA